MSDITPPTTDDPIERIYGDLPEPEYHDREGLGSSALRRAAASIDEYEHYRREGIDKTDAIRLGSCVHQAVLEPDRWSNRIDVPPPPDGYDDLSGTQRAVADAMAEGDPDPKTVADEQGVSVGYVERCLDDDDVQAAADWMAEHDAADCPDDETVETVEAIAERVRSHPQWLEAGDSELSIFWGHEVKKGRPELPDYVQGKGRLDRVAQTDDGLIAVDLKTTGRSARPGEWTNRVLGPHNLWLQAAWYTEGVEALTGEEVDRFVFFVVETSEPYGRSAIALEPHGEHREAFDHGWSIADRACHQLADHARGRLDFTGYSRELHTAQIRDWHLDV